MEKDLDDKVEENVGEDEQSKLDSKGFDEIMGAVTSDVHDDVHLHHHHHHATDDDLHHLLPLTLTQEGEVQVASDLDGDVKDEHVPRGATPTPPSVLTGAQLLVPDGEQTPEEDAGANPQKIIKRGRGGRRAGAGRKRKSDAAKAEATAGAAAEVTKRATTSPAKPMPSLQQPSAAGSYTTAARAVGGGGLGVNIGGHVNGVVGGAGGPTGGPPAKKKKLASTMFDEGGAESYKKVPRQLKFGKTILYVKEVEATVEFYERAFGLRRRFVHETKQYAELETGATALSFASNELARNNLAHVEFRPNDPNAQPPGMEIAFSSLDVHRDYKRALEAGAKPVSIPKTLPWGQVVAYVRDLNGVLVEIATELKTPLKK